MTIALYLMRLYGFLAVQRCAEHIALTAQQSFSRVCRLKAISKEFIGG
jgi:hypothetical protein